jgi:hypothetical protein
MTIVLNILAVEADSISPEADFPDEVGTHKLGVSIYIYSEPCFCSLHEFPMTVLSWLGSLEWQG